MKRDDNTFVRIDTVMAEANKIQSGRSFYNGNINYYHNPLRHGEWDEEWPVVYPPYANGPGYIVSADIAQYAVSEFEKHKLRVCASAFFNPSPLPVIAQTRLLKMEDVSMGMWVFLK